MRKLYQVFWFVILLGMVSSCTITKRYHSHGFTLFQFNKNSESRSAQPINKRSYNIIKFRNSEPSTIFNASFNVNNSEKCVVTDTGKYKPSPKMNTEFGGADSTTKVENRNESNDNNEVVPTEKPKTSKSKFLQNVMTFFGILFLIFLRIVFEFLMQYTLFAVLFLALLLFAIISSIVKNNKNRKNEKK